MGIRKAVVPFANREEAALVEGVEVLGPSASATWHAGTASTWTRCHSNPFRTRPRAALVSADVPDLVDVIGQADAVDALTVAAAGAHHL
jgi:magnesium chelatase family protein